MLTCPAGAAAPGTTTTWESESACGVRAAGRAWRPAAAPPAGAAHTGRRRNTSDVRAAGAITMLVLNYDGAGERYYCVECCSKKPRNSRIPTPGIWTPLMAAVEHAFYEPHRAGAFAMRRVESMQEVRRIVSESRQGGAA